jgi:hypothetical protein
VRWRRLARPLSIEAEAKVERDAKPGDPENPETPRVNRRWRAEEWADIWISDQISEADEPREPER